MKILKGFTISLVSFLLFLSLATFGIVLTLNNTILNPDFVISEMDKADLYTVVEEQITEQIPSDPDIDKYLTPAVNDTLTQLKPWVKDQAKQALYTAYDYLKGKTDTLNIVIPTAVIEQALQDNTWKV